MNLCGYSILVAHICGLILYWGVAKQLFLNALLSLVERVHYVKLKNEVWGCE